jgi:hypothetical protein
MVTLMTLVDLCMSEFVGFQGIPEGDTH